MSQASLAEEAFAASWAEEPLPGADLVREHRFHATRRWRFDFAFPSQKLAIEIDGRGRHQTVAGVRSDCEKHNEATRMGWRVLHFPATDKKEAPVWVDLVKECLCAAT